MACCGGRSWPSLAIARHGTGAPLPSFKEYVRSESTGVMLTKRKRYEVPTVTETGAGCGEPFMRSGSLVSTPSREKRKILSVSGLNFAPGSKTISGPVRPLPQLFLFVPVG